MAQGLQRNGITALLYDPRNTGASEGFPRNEIDPPKQVEDFSDALTYMLGLEVVDPERIGLWGISFGGMVAACAAALDKRAKFVIMTCPLVKLYDPGLMPRVLEKTAKDRMAQLKGNKPFMLPLVTQDGYNPTGLVGQSGKEVYEALKYLNARSPEWEMKTTLQSYYRVAMWQPHGLIQTMMAQTPVLVIIPGNDNLCPPEKQVAFFETLQGPKQKLVVAGKNHFNILTDDQEILEAQIDFVHRWTASRRSP